MKKITTSILLQLLFILLAYSQGTNENVCVGSVTLSSQAQVDAFTCTEVTRFLYISGPDITNLDSLYRLQRVGAGIFPGSALTIENNPLLKNLDGLSSLTDIKGDIKISNNPSLEKINGFPLVTNLTSLVISDNSALTSIKGFTNLESIAEAPFSTTTLAITNNVSLSNIDGLSSLKMIQGRAAFLNIRGNISLPDLDGLSSLEKISGGGVAGGLSIADNPSLRHVNGLSSLSNVSGAFGNLVITNNAALQNLDGLSNLRENENGGAINYFVRVRHNPSLTRCCGLFQFLESLREANTQSTIDIAENGATCTLEDILTGGPCPQSISSFSLINQLTGDVVLDFYESITLDIANPDFSKWTIQANAFPDSVGSVVFRLDKKIKQIENVFPYTLQKNVLSFLKPGMHALTTEVFSKSHKRGEQGIGRTAIINVINSAAILNFQVVDTSGKVLMDLNDGDAINIKDPAFKRISIIANTTTKNVGSVKFWLNDRKYNVENQVPYSLNGDYGGYFNLWKARAGNYTLAAVPYSRNGGQGYAGQTKKIQFKVIEEEIRNEKETKVNIANARSTEYLGEEILFSMFPVPVEDELYIKIDKLAGNSFFVTIRNIQGQSVHAGSYSIYHLETTGIRTAGWQSGIYYMQILGNNGFGKIVKFVKK